MIKQYRIQCLRNDIPWGPIDTGKRKNLGDVGCVVAFEGVSDADCDSQARWFMSRIEFTAWELVPHTPHDAETAGAGKGKR